MQDTPTKKLVIPEPILVDSNGNRVNRKKLDVSVPLQEKNTDIIETSELRPSEEGGSFLPPSTSINTTPTRTETYPPTSVYSKKLPDVRLQFDGAFGQMVATFTDVIITDALLVLVVDTTQNNYYIPPVSPTATLKIVKKDTYTVVNPGLQFEHNKQLYIIMLRV